MAPAGASGGARGASGGTRAPTSGVHAVRLRVGSWPRTGHGAPCRRRRRTSPCTAWETRWSALTLPLRGSAVLLHPPRPTCSRTPRLCCAARHITVPGAHRGATKARRRAAKRAAGGAHPRTRGFWAHRDACAVDTRAAVEGVVPARRWVAPSRASGAERGRKQPARTGLDRAWWCVAAARVPAAASITHQHPAGVFHLRSALVARAARPRRGRLAQLRPRRCYISRASTTTGATSLARGRRAAQRVRHGAENSGAGPGAGGCGLDGVEHVGMSPFPHELNSPSWPL